MVSKSISPSARYFVTLVLIGLGSSFAIHIFNLGSVCAQSPPITPSGLSTDVLATDSGKTHTITGGTREGTNLFHSFGVFNVPQDHIANFLNESGADTSNILARVTGESPSLIYGAIKTTGFGDASLFLMNPAGIVFGPNATLNVGGPVAFTTAHYLRLAQTNGVQSGIFHVDPSGPNILTSAPVTAYGFLTANSSSIAIQESMLQVQPDQSISLVAGNQGFEFIHPDTHLPMTVPGGLTMVGGQISAPNGQILVGSIASSGELQSSTLAPAPNTDGNSPTSLGNITLSGNAVMNTSGHTGGTIRIRGGQFIMDSAGLIAHSTNGTDLPATGILVEVSDSISLSNASAIFANTQGDGLGSAIELSSRNVTLTGGSRIRTESQAAGKAGDVTITASESLSVTGVDASDNPTIIQSDTIGSGRSGAITASAPLIRLADRGSIETRAFSDGRASDVTLRGADGIELRDGGSIATYGSSVASSGNIHLSASDVILVSGQFGDIQSSRIENQNSAGETGSIFITTNHLELANRGRINLDTFQNSSGIGAPTVRIRADSSITLSNESRIDSNSFLSDVGPLEIGTKTLHLSDLSIINTRTNGVGASGPILIGASDITLRGGSQITSASLGGVGRGGDISISSSGSIVLTGQATNTSGEVRQSGIFSNTTTEIPGLESNGNAGQITLRAESLMITDGARIDSSSKGFAMGDAGNISINAGQQLDVQNGSITTKADQASGGNIDIRAVDRVRFVNSLISASVGADSGNGGNITIDPNVVVLQNSQVLASAVQGRGGDITITTPVFLADPASLVDASSQFGLSGRVNIQSPTSNLSGTVKQLPSKPSDTQALLQNRCAALAGGDQSTFIVAGRDARPLEPGGWLSSPISMEHLTGEGLEHASGLRSSTRAAEKEILSLRRLTPPGFLVRAFAVGPTGCRS
jgi:filamentous hemagglutinin family protein